MSVNVGTLPKCLRLRVDSAVRNEFPGDIRLRAERGLGHGLLAADGGPERFRLYNYASWRPAGRDSIDIAWHHSPVIRLPVHGDSLVGRAAWSGAAPIWQLIGLRDRRVVARAFPCSEFIVHAS